MPSVGDTSQVVRRGAVLGLLGISLFLIGRHYLGLGLVALGLLGGSWLVPRLMTATGRNQGALHGGGCEEANADTIVSDTLDEI